MQLKSSVLLLWHLIRQIQCENTSFVPGEEPTLDYYEFRMKHGDVIDYEELVKKMEARNKTEDYTTYGDDWAQFTDNTHIVMNLPAEMDVNASKTTDDARNPFDVLANVQFLTFPADNETTTVNVDDESQTYDLTHMTTCPWTFKEEKLFFEILHNTKDNRGRWFTEEPTPTFDETAYDILLNADEEWLAKFGNMTSSEQEEKLHEKDFFNCTITSTRPTPTTWNPFLVQSEERRELDRIAKEKRMATNNQLRDMIKSGQFGGGLGGLGGLLGGGIIPINLGNLGNLMGGFKPITITLSGDATKTTQKPTTPRSTVSPKTFKPRPEAKDFMQWRYLEDSSPRPPMPETEMIRILNKYGTPPPYHIEPVSIPANISEDVIDHLMDTKNNATYKWEVDEGQRDRIYNFMNPFIQQHTAMDLLNIDDNVDKFTAPSTTIPSPKAAVTTPSTATTTRLTVPKGIFTTDAFDDNRMAQPWREGGFREMNKTIDPFDRDNLIRVLNEGRRGELTDWKRESLKERSTPVYDKDPKIRALEEDLHNVFDRDAQKKRQERVDEVIEQVKKDKEKRRKLGITKPPYWKEVLKSKPIEPLFEHKNTTDKKSEELRHLFNILREAQDTFPRTVHRTSQSHQDVTRADPTPLATHQRTMMARGETVAEKKVEQTTKSRWTTPVEDKERLQTILSFMFPYIQKKSEIFDTDRDKQHKDGTRTSSPTQDKQETTTFDPWGSEDDNLTPPEHLKNIVNDYIRGNTTIKH